MANSDTLRMALDAVRANKARGILTTLGIVIGIVAVVVTMTAANGLQNNFRESFAAVGTDALYVSKMPWIVMNDFFQFRNRPNLDLREARALETKLHGRAIVNPTMSSGLDVKFGNETMEGVDVIGTTEKQIRFSGALPQSGRFLLSSDLSSKKSVCVIGTDVQKGLFGNSNPVGKTIQIGRSAFRVVGLMEKQGGGFMGGPNFDRQIFVPITSYVIAFGGNRGRQEVNIAVKASEPAALPELEYEVIGEMRAIRRLRPVEPENFSINKLDTLMDGFNKTMGILFLVGLSVTSISLFVGAVGVMNIMFVSVTERTREIGIRKAIGATRRSILLQFLFESSTICLAGGVIGILLAAGVTAILNAMVMPASLSIPILAVAVAVSIGVGVLAGMAPAYRGARLEPIAALRHD